MDKYGLVKIHNPYAKFVKSILIGLALILTSAVSVTTGFFGLNSLNKKEEVIAASGLWSSYVDTSWLGSGGYYSPYEIWTAEELAGLSKRVADGSSFQNTYFVVKQSINLSAHYWIPIGTMTSSYSWPSTTFNATWFNGHFDGGGHIISNMFINLQNHYAVGLFGSVGNNESHPTIKNFGVTGQIHTYQNDEGEGRTRNFATNIGSIVGSGYADITDVWSSVNIYADHDLESSLFFGDRALNVGGIYGGLQPMNGYAPMQPTIMRAYNSGYISASSFKTEVRVGGILGFIEKHTLPAGWNTALIRDVYYTGTIIGSNEGTQYVHSGGIAGYIVQYGTLEQAYNIGSVSGGTHVGAILGRTGSYLTDTEMTVRRCYYNANIGSYGVGIGGVEGTLSYSAMNYIAPSNWYIQSNFYNLFNYSNYWAMSTYAFADGRPVIKNVNNYVITLSSNGGSAI
ncbi:MAG: hypothetical protein PHC46_01660 [Clostridia bacterium]|nr:hypothetical protein [Clostridia bacterium]